MRLIDADALMKQIRLMASRTSLGETKPNEISSIEVISLINNAPTVDAVEVVRCKDCQYAKQYDRNDGKTGYYCQHQNCTFLYGTNWKRLFEPIREANDFCSYGKRKVSE